MADGRVDEGSWRSRQANGTMSRARAAEKYLRGGHLSQPREGEYAARIENEHKHEEYELDDGCPAYRHEWGGETLNQSECQSSEERTGRIAETTEDGHDKALELVGLAREHREGKQRRDQRSRHASEGNAETERHREHLGGGNAVELGCFPVAGDRANGLADAGVVQQQIEQAGNHEGEDGGHDVVAGECVAVPCDAGK